MLATSCGARTSLLYSPTSPQLDARIAGSASPSSSPVVASTGEITAGKDAGTPPGNGGGSAERDCSRLLDMDMGGVAGTEAVAEAEAGVGGCVSPRRQRREEREKRLRGRGSSRVGVVVVGLIEWTDGADRSGPVRTDAEPRRRRRFLFDCVPPEEPGVRVSDDFDRGELDMLTTGRVRRELVAIGVCVSPRV